MNLVNEWRCACCSMLYATSDQMTLEEANTWYNVNPDAVRWWEIELCLGCEKRLVLVPRYTDEEIALSRGQLPLWAVK